MTSLPLPRPKLPDDSSPDEPVWNWRHIVVLGGLLVVLLLVLTVRAFTAERRAIENMEPHARATLYQETWKGFQQLCLPQADSALTGRCHDQAQFLQQFPECDAACHQELYPFIQPSR